MDIKEIHKRFEQVLIEEARQEGKKETLLNTAKRMLLDGMNMLLIHKYTGLSMKELNTLAKNLQ